MRAYVSPQFVFEREPNQLDRAVRVGKQVVAVAQALLNGQANETSAQARLYESDDSLEAYGFAFTEHWRDVLGDRLNHGVRLRTTQLPYQIEVTITKDDTLPKPPGIDSQYKANLDFVVTQPKGRSTRLRFESRTTHPSDDVVLPGGCVPVTFFSQVLPLREDGRVNSSGWGMYTHDEAAELNEVAVRLMREIDAAAVIPGALEITDLD